MTAPEIKRATCSNFTRYSSELANLESTYDDLCSEFSSVLAPFSTQMPYGLWTTFSVWSSSWATLMQSKTEIISQSQGCRVTPLKAPITSTYYLTAGCASLMQTIYDYRCPGYGQIFNGYTTIGTAWWPCTAPATAPGAEPPASHLTITSQASTSTFAPYVITTSQASQTRSGHDVYSAEPPKSHLTITSQSSEATEISQPSLVVTTNSDQSTYTSTVASGLVQGTSSAVPEPSHMLVGSPTNSNTPVATGFHLASDEVISTRPFTKVTYFIALFFAPILAVFVKIYYEVIVASLKLAEPFQHMSSAGGTTVAYSLLLNYLSTASPKDISKSAAAGYLLPLWSAIMHLLVGVTPALVSASMSVRSRATCDINQTSRRCDPAWVINMTVIRSVEAALLLCACLVAFLIVSTWEFSVNVSSNPSSIVSIAAMLNHEPLQRDLLQVEPEANEKLIKIRFTQHRFWLREHQDPRSGQYHHGIIGQKDLTIRPSSQKKTKLQTTSQANRGFPSTTLVKDCFQLITTVCLLGLVLTYTLDYSHDIFNTFFSSQGVLPKLIIVGVATLADTQLKAMERTVRTTDPYRRLALGQARPETTILLPLNGTCWSNLPRCISCLVRYKDGHMKWQTTVSLVACLSDFNIIAAAGLLFTDSQTWDAFVACAWVSVALSALMLLVAVVNLVWWGSIKVFRDMPRRPQTLAATMSYLCGSSCLEEWRACAREMGMTRFEDMTEKERWNMVVGSGRLFRFGKMMSVVDERMRWCIEFDSESELEVTEISVGNK